MNSCGQDGKLENSFPNGPEECALNGSSQKWQSTFLARQFQQPHSTLAILCLLDARIEAIEKSKQAFIHRRLMGDMPGEVFRVLMNAYAAELTALKADRDTIRARGFGSSS